MPCGADESCSFPLSSTAHKCLTCKCDVHGMCSRKIPGTRDTTGDDDWEFYCSTFCSGYGEETTIHAGVSQPASTHIADPLPEPEAARNVPIPDSGVSKTVSKRLLEKYVGVASGRGAGASDTSVTRLVKRARVAVESLNTTASSCVFHFQNNNSSATQADVQGMIESTQLAQLEL